MGEAEKLAAHENGGQLHRAFSIFLFDARGRLLLQQRAACKYHFAGRWSNTCCGHPRPGEPLIGAAERRLHEEFGIASRLKATTELRYHAHDPVSGLTEREYLHILAGAFDGAPTPNPEEIADFRWATIDVIQAELAADATHYSPWFPIALNALLAADDAGPIRP